MIELNVETVVPYLKQRGHLGAGESATAQELGWGVSNIVLRINRAIGPDWVLKQSRPQLRTDVPWFSRIDRIHREADVMRVLAGILPAGVVPEILCEDRDNYWFAMQAVDAGHQVWKQMLLGGQPDADIASRLGSYLAMIHSKTAEHPELTESFVDRSVFEELRVAPFYRHLADKFDDVRPEIDAMIANMSAHSHCLVLGDFSPKNILIIDQEIVLVDFETGHRGDPVFDLGFFLSHLLLKTVLHADRFDHYTDLTRGFWAAYLAGIASLDTAAWHPDTLQRRTIPHLACCMWARIDATSPVDYLPHEPQRALVRNFSRRLLQNPPATWDNLLAELQTQIR